MTISMYRQICGQLNLAVGAILDHPQQLAEALDTLDAAGGAAMFYPWLSKPVVLLGLAGDSLGGPNPIPVLVGGALVISGAGPVIRLSLTLFDDPAAPMQAECWINVADEWEREALERTVAEETLKIVACRGRAVQRILSVSLKLGASPNLRDVANQAVASLARFEPSRLDWPKARAAAEALLAHRTTGH